MAEGINKKYDIEIEVVTPLSIGAGAEKDWVKGVDFVVQDGKLYKLNLRKMVAEGIEISKLTICFAEKNEKGVLALIGSKLNEVSDAVFNMSANTTKDVKSFVKNQLTGNPIIAGSSIKGSVRSVLFNYLRTNENNDKVVFGSSTKGDEFMRFIKFSDSEFDKTELVNTKIFNLQNKGSWQGGWKHEIKTNSTFSPEGFNTIYECIMPGNKSDASIMFSAEIFNKIKEQRLLDKKKTIIEEGLDKLFAIINNHTKKYLQKELDFFKKYKQADKTEKIIKSIEHLITMIPDDNSYCLLKMSAGSGFHSITGDWQFDDYTETGTWAQGKQKYKSRKIATHSDCFDLMGFIKISSLSQEAKKQYIEKRIQRLKSQEDECLRRIKEKEQQSQAEAKQRMEEAEKQVRFDTLIKDAIAHSETNQYEIALKEFEEAKRINPNYTVHDNDIKILKAKIGENDLKKKLAENEEKMKGESRKANLIPLSQKIANSKKLGTLFSNVKKWVEYNGNLNENDKSVLKIKIEEIYISMSPREKKQLKSFGRDLDLIITPELAKQWFDDIANS